MNDTPLGPRRSNTTPGQGEDQGTGLPTGVDRPTPVLADLPPADTAAPPDFHVRSAWDMLGALGWSGCETDVIAVATDIFRDHLLNFSVAAAQQWGVEFWAQQPTPRVDVPNADHVVNEHVNPPLDDRHDEHE